MICTSLTYMAKITQNLRSLEIFLLIRVLLNINKFNTFSMPYFRAPLKRCFHFVLTVTRKTLCYKYRYFDIYLHIRMKQKKDQFQSFLPYKLHTDNLTQFTCIVSKKNIKITSGLNKRTQG